MPSIVRYSTSASSTRGESVGLDLGTDHRRDGEAGTLWTGLISLAAELVLARVGATVTHARIRDVPLPEEQDSQARDRIGNFHRPVVVRVTGVVTWDLELTDQSGFA